MFLKKIYIENFRVLKDIEIQFEKEFTPTVFPLGSLNGGGKSTLLQLVFTLLHCSFQKQRHQYLVNLLSTLSAKVTTLAKFDILHENKEFYLEFIVSENKTLAENSKNILYITHFNNEKVLLCKTNLDDTEILPKMSDKVYLAAPSTQIFLFLSEQEKEAFFSRESGIIHYIDYLNQAKEKLTGFFPYDFASTNLIIKSFEKARDKDFEDALENGKYGFIITVNKELSSIVFKLKNDNEKLLPEDLSHGELKKLSIYIWLKYYAIEDSLILMDEIEIGLHPDWQYEIVNELQEWAKTNQFILATHSYELCQALTPSHVKVRNKS